MYDDVGRCTNLSSCQVCDARALESHVSGLRMLKAPPDPGNTATETDPGTHLESSVCLLLFLGGFPYESETFHNITWRLDGAYSSIASATKPRAESALASFTKPPATLKLHLGPEQLWWLCRTSGPLVTSRGNSWNVFRRPKG